MRKFALLASSAVLILVACGGGQPEEASVSPLDVLPDASLFSMAFIDPSAVISSLDGYASGVPVLGANAVSGWILSALDCADMSEVQAKMGIKTDGGLVVFMESMMPQSMGAALTVSDPDTFWANIGVTPQEAEPLEGLEVSSIPVDFGSIYFCYTRGLLLAAGSRAGLQSMISRMDGNLPDLPEIPDGSIYIYTNVQSFGPMVANQIAMFRPQIMAEVSANENVDADIMQNIIGLYFDAIDMFLKSTESYSCVISLGPEYITGKSNINFIPGSTLDQYLIPVDVQDMSSMIPAGDVLVGRANLDPSTSAAIMNSIFGALDIQDFPQDLIQFWAQTMKSTAVSMSYSPENPIHVTAVYSLPDQATLEDVKNAYDEQFSAIAQYMQWPGLQLEPVHYQEYQGMDWITFSMNMDMSAMVPDTVEMPSGENISWTAWMTVSDGYLYLEMAPEPVQVASIIDGTYQGSYASEIPEMSEISDSAELAFMFNVPGYMNMAMGMSGLDVPPIDSDPVWVTMQMDIRQGGMNGQFRVSGTDLSAFIGNAIQTFSAMAAQ